MNKKLRKVRDEIEKMNKKIQEDEEYLKQLRARERQLEDTEIIESIRSMQVKGGDVMSVLAKIQSLQKMNENERREFHREVTSNVEK